jgi:two-component system sensor histidine kinase KdpD
VFNSQLTGISRHADLVDEIVRHAELLLDADIVILERDEQTAGAALRIAARAPAAIEFASAAEARECLETERPVDHRMAPGLGHQWAFRPLHVGDRALAVLGIRPRAPEARASQAEARLIDLLAEQVEVNLDRIRLAEEMRGAEMRAETEKLRAALLTSISHDLRTPLASILGNVTSVRH